MANAGSVESAPKVGLKAKALIATRDASWIPRMNDFFWYYWRQAGNELTAPTKA